jgi:hypothetical protein
MFPGPIGPDKAVAVNDAMVASMPNAAGPDAAAMSAGHRVIEIQTATSGAPATAATSGAPATAATSALPAPDGGCGEATVARLPSSSSKLAMHIRLAARADRCEATRVMLAHLMTVDAALGQALVSGDEHVARCSSR